MTPPKANNNRNLLLFKCSDHTNSVTPTTFAIFFTEGKKMKKPDSRPNFKPDRRIVHQILEHSGCSYLSLYILGVDLNRQKCGHPIILSRPKITRRGHASYHRLPY